MSETVSVIIPAYNSSRTLVRAIESVLMQSLPASEIIVVDDGSTDDTVKVLAPYSDRIRYVHQENAGASSARNRGCSMATGDFLAFLDADDVWHPAKLERQVVILNLHPQIGMCWSDPCILPEVEAVSIAKRVTEFPVQLKQEVVANFDDIFRSPFLGTPNVLIRRTVFEASGGFDTGFVTAEDLDLWLRVAYTYRAVHLPEQLCFVMRQAQSLSTRHSDKLFLDHLAAIEKFCSLHPDFAQHKRSLVKEAQAKVYEHWGSALLTGLQPRHAVKVLGRSLSLHLTTRTGYLFIKALAFLLLNRGGAAR